MRNMAYAVVALAAVGIAIMVIKMPEVPLDKIQPSSASRVMAEAGTLTLSVPKMHCPFACYPAIKKTLEETGAVESVELAEQKEEGVIDNRQVIVQYKSGFNLDAAIKLLDDKGFSDSDIVQ